MGKVFLLIYIFFFGRLRLRELIRNNIMGERSEPSICYDHVTIKIKNSPSEANAVSCYSSLILSS